MTVPIRPPDPRVMKALAAYKKQGLNRLADMAGLSQGTGDAVQSFAMGATEPLDVKGALRAARRGIEAWHGSPHKFDKFSLEKIGTGEGAQAYGHGLYFAESRPVAESYRAMAEPSYRNAGVQTIVSDAIESARKAGLSENAARIAARNDIIKQAMERPSSLRQQWFDAANNLDGILDDPKAGSLYRVRLDVSPDELLDWDAPIAGQHERIQAAIERLIPDMGPRWKETGAWPHVTGGQAYKRAEEEAIGIGKAEPFTTKRAQVAEKLRKRGVAGIQYLDGGSRAAGDGTRNYVIFDPERIQILERLAALGIGGEAVRKMLAQAKASAQPQPQQPATLPAVTVGR